MKSHRRRASTRDFDEEEDQPSLVEILIGAVLDPMVRSTVIRVKGGVRTVVDWTMKRLIASWVVAAFLIGGIVLILAAGVKGLEALHCPPWLSYLSMGIVALIAALLLLKKIQSSAEDEDFE